MDELDKLSDDAGTKRRLESARETWELLFGTLGMEGLGAYGPGVT